MFRNIGEFENCHRSACLPLSLWRIYHTPERCQ
jgi:hypothetical protein